MLIESILLGAGVMISHLINRKTHQQVHQMAVEEIDAVYREHDKRQEERDKEAQEKLVAARDRAAQELVDGLSAKKLIDKGDESPITIEELLATIEQDRQDEFRQDLKDGNFESSPEHAAARIIIHRVCNKKQNGKRQHRKQPEGIFQDKPEPHDPETVFQDGAV